jgi:cytochrome c
MSRHSGMHPAQLPPSVLPGGESACALKTPTLTLPRSTGRGNKSTCRPVTIAIVSCVLLLAVGCDSEKKQIARAIAGGDPDKGQAAIYDYGCASCHTIPGIRGANALVGPPLTQEGGRVYIAGVLQNTPQNMIKWIEDPPGVDPKTAMPNLHVKQADARDIATYLYTLQ